MSTALQLQQQQPPLSQGLPRLNWTRQHNVVLLVGLLHAGLIYGVHQSMRHLPPVITEGARLISQVEVITAPPTPTPQLPPPPAPTLTPKAPPKPELQPQPRPVKAVPPRPVLSTDAPGTSSVAPAPTAVSATPATAAPTAPIAPTAPAPANATNHAADNPTTSSNAATASPAKAAEPALEQPSSRAQYLNNPKPSYPPTSKRLGEEGKVVIRVLISAEGVPSQAQIHKSSGFERLDQAALETVARWRFVPGKRGGVPEAMWFNVPINFVLD